MTRIERLPLQRPLAIAGAPGGIWIADAASKSAVLFDAASTDILASVALDDEPRSIAASGELIAVALNSGEVVALGGDDREHRWRRRCVSTDVVLRASGNRIWAWDRGASAFLTWDQSGSEDRFDSADVVAFAPADDAVYSLTSNGTLRFQSRAGPSSSARLPDAVSPTAVSPTAVSPTAAILLCANSLWIGVANGLLLAARDTLAARATLRVPEPAVTHLICYNGRVFGGGRSVVFSVEPAADDNARSLGITLRSPLLGLGVSGKHLWALETATPHVHVVRIP